MTENTKSIMLDDVHCPDCESSNLVEDYDLGEVVCSNCGLVAKEHVINEGPEWRAFTSEEREERSRAGPPTSLSIHDKGLSTVIDQVNRDAFGKVLPASTRFQMLRLRKWQSRARVNSSVDKNLSTAMSELDRLADRVQVSSSVKEEASMIYRKALGKRLVRGRSILAIAAAALYAACRFAEIPRTLNEVSEASLVKKKYVARCYRLLLKELGIIMPIDDPIRCVPKISSKISIDEKTQQSAIKLLNKAEEKKVVTGKDPMGLAAAAIYIACILNFSKRTQKDIAEASGITEVTLRNRAKQLKRILKLDF